MHVVLSVCLVFYFFDFFFTLDAIAITNRHSHNRRKHSIEMDESEGGRGRNGIDHHITVAERNRYSYTYICAHKRRGNLTGGNVNMCRGITPYRLMHGLVTNSNS